MTAQQKFEFRCMELVNKSAVPAFTAFTSPEFPHQVLVFEWRKSQWMPFWYTVAEVTE